MYYLGAQFSINFIKILDTISHSKKMSKRNKIPRFLKCLWKVFIFGDAVLNIGNIGIFSIKLVFLRGFES